MVPHAYFEKIDELIQFSFYQLIMSWTNLWMFIFSNISGWVLIILIICVGYYSWLLPVVRTFVLGTSYSLRVCRYIFLLLQMLDIDLGCVLFSLFPWNSTSAEINLLLLDLFRWINLLLFNLVSMNSWTYFKYSQPLACFERDLYLLLQMQMADQFSNHWYLICCNPFIKNILLMESFLNLSEIDSSKQMFW